jgi:integrase/recombinase XerD
MWVEGTANGTYLRRSLKTASWERATELSRVVEESDKPAETPERKDAPVTVVQAVTEYLANAKARELADATLYKLKIQLEKQFLGWCKAEGYKGSLHQTLKTVR